MKNFKTSLLAAMAVLFLISCSDDDDAAPGLAFGTGTGNVSIGTESYSFDKGLILNFGANDGSDTFNFDIELYSGDLTLNPVTGPAGIGNNLSLELNSTQSSGLKNGTYTYDFGADSDLSLSDAFVEIDLNFTTFDSTASFDAESGTVVVNKSGNTYTITIDLMMDNGERMTGTYTGTLGAVDARNL